MKDTISVDEYALLSEDEAWYYHSRYNATKQVWVEEICHECGHEHWGYSAQPDKDSGIKEYYSMPCAISKMMVHEMIADAKKPSIFDKLSSNNGLVLMREDFSI